MPVILEPASDDLNTWLNPKRHEWNKELQSILKPWDGDLEIYAVSKDVNKVGNSSSSFIVPVASKENKNNIANFFANASGAKKDATKGAADTKAETKSPKPNSSQLENQKGLSTTSTKTPVKRPADVGPLNPDEEPPQKSKPRYKHHRRPKSRRHLSLERPLARPATEENGVLPRARLILQERRKLPSFSPSEDI